MKPLSLLALAGALLAGCTIDGQPMIQPVTADNPAAEVHMSAPAIAAEEGPMSF